MLSWDKKLNSEPNDERRYSSAPIAQMWLLAVVFYFSRLQQRLQALLFLNLDAVLALEI
jgi:hypothetical protein